MRWAVALLAVWVVCVGGRPAWGLDHVVVRREQGEVRLSGRVVVKARDGGLMFQTPDGVLWTVQPKELVEQTSDKEPFAAYSPEELSKQVLGGLPEGFDVHRTAHYVVFHNTGRAYAQWCGSLFERLYMGFTNYWSRRGLKLTEPEFPLVAVVFADRQSYEKFARADLGDAVGSIVGYFDTQTNRMTMFDLTRSVANGLTNDRAKGQTISQILAQPEAARTVSTIVHEATHQIAFNCGMQKRCSDCPLWLSEGIAVYFENPDLRSAKGWRTIGGVNEPRLRQFWSYLERRPADSLRTLLRDGKRFRDTQQALDAYGEAWALTYFLIRKHPKQFVEYLKMLSQKKPLLRDTREARLEEFERAFGKLDKLDAEFLRYMQRER